MPDKFSSISETDCISEADCLSLIVQLMIAITTRAKQQYQLKLAALSPSDQIALGMFTIRWYRQFLNTKDHAQSENPYIRRVFFYMLSPFYASPPSSRLPLSRSQVLEVLTDAQSPPVPNAHNWLSNTHLLQLLVTAHLKKNHLDQALAKTIEKTCTVLNEYWDHPNSHLDRERNTHTRLVLTSNGLEHLPVISDKAWSRRAGQHISALSIEERTHWNNLLKHCRKNPGSNPTQKWLKATRHYRKTVGVKSFVAAFINWLPLMSQPSAYPTAKSWNETNPYNDVDILRGLVWLCADQDSAELAQEIGTLAAFAYQKVPKMGSRKARLGNACLWTLKNMPTHEALSQIALLKAKVKSRSARKMVEKALAIVAEREGISLAEIEEISAPTYGLIDVGIRREKLGDYTAELLVTGTHSTTLRWIKPDGKLQKSVPKIVREKYSEELKALNQTAKDIQKMLPAQRDRIESLYLQQKTWDFATWRSRYLNHSLIGTLARRIIWQFESKPNAKERFCTIGIWQNGQIIDVEGNPITGLKATTQVSLWHPITTDIAGIQAWRHWLIEAQVQQPFKQAHREIYLITPAEEATRTYSNRFAAHIIKQHQFKALCDQRGWQNSLKLACDLSDSPVALTLPKWNLRVEFLVEGICDEESTDLSEAWAYLYMTTDRVRFRSLTNGSLPLSEIPALVFSEVMRDVDLFVGVTSVGNDPNWVDKGNEGNRRRYWQSYSFGELSATAQTRRQVLKALIPKLKKIRDRCTFQDRFLVVKGDIRTYKIHLGSGNILMEPNDQYLCIVNSYKGGADSVFLPFEGDKMLSLILSKAFLLADDVGISDRTITKQIKEL